MFDGKYRARVSPKSMSMLDNIAQLQSFIWLNTYVYMTTVQFSRYRGQMLGCLLDCI
jgi:hypothetical protein